MSARTSRRGLLKGTMAWTLLAGLGSGAEIQEERQTTAGDDQLIRLGLIGCGGRGQHLMRVALSNPDVRVVAVCDVVAERMAQAAKIAGEGTGLHKDFRSLLDRKDVDAVIVATPDHWHCVQTIAACEAGKDVYVEKPLGHNIAEGRAAVNAARRFKRIVQHGTQQLSGAHYQAAKELIRSGALGSITRVRVWNVWNDAPTGMGNPPDEPVPSGVDYDLWLGPAPKRPFNRNRFYAPGYWFFWDYSGGFMLSWAIHHLDTVHWITGKTVPLMAMSTGGKFVLKDNRETPDTQDALIDYGDYYVQASIYHTNARPIEGSWYGIAFYGTNGTMLLTREGFRVFPEGDRMKPIEQGESPQDPPHMRNWLDCIKTREKPVADIEFGHLSNNPLHLVNISYRLRRAVHWDGARELIVRDEEANRYLCRTYRKPWGRYVYRYLAPQHKRYYRETD